jgi:hypothetical protein
MELAGAVPEAELDASLVVVAVFVPNFPHGSMRNKFGPPRLGWVCNNPNRPRVQVNAPGGRRYEFLTRNLQSPAGLDAIMYAAAAVAAAVVATATACA